MQLLHNDNGSTRRTAQLLTSIVVHSRRVWWRQDLGRLGRDLARTVLVDDTPLAFCRQPDNGIPVFNFRSAAPPPPFVAIPQHPVSA